jgi:hypothetical protein
VVDAASVALNAWDLHHSIGRIAGQAENMSLDLKAEDE